MKLPHTQEEAIPRRYELASTLTIAQLAKELNISRRHVYSLVAQYLIPYAKHGGRVRFRRAAVAAAIERLTVHATPHQIGSPNMHTPLLTVPELARELNISESKIYELKDQRVIPHVRLGKSVRFDREAVLAAIKRLTVHEHDRL
jgi:excisionase family DNA binding protein